MEIQPFPGRRPRSPTPGRRPRASHEHRLWDDKQVDSRNRLRMDITIRQAAIATHQRKIADHEEAIGEALHQQATEDQQATSSHVEYADQPDPGSPPHQFHGFPPSAFAPLVPGPTLPALQSVSPSSQMALPRATIPLRGDAPPYVDPTSYVGPASHVGPAARTNVPLRGDAPYAGPTSHVGLTHRADTPSRTSVPCRASEVQFQWSEAPGTVNTPDRAHPIPARLPKRGEIQFQWSEAPELHPTADRTHSPSRYGSQGYASLVRQSDRDEYDDPPPHGHPSPRTMPAPSTFRPNTFGTAEPSSWRERLPLRPVLEPPRWEITRSDWLGRPPRTSAKVGYYGITEENVSPPVSNNTTSRSYGNNFGVHTSSLHLAGTGTGTGSVSIDFSSPYNNEGILAPRPSRDMTRSSSFLSPRNLVHNPYDDSTQAVESSSPRDIQTSSPHSITARRVASTSRQGSSPDDDEDEQHRETSEHISSRLSSSPDRHRGHDDQARLSTYHSFRKRSRHDDQVESEEKPRKRSKHRTSHHSSHSQAHHRRNDNDDNRDGHESGGRSTQPSSHHERHHQEHDSAHSTTRHGPDSSHGGGHHHADSADSTANRISHYSSHRSRHHQPDDSTHSGRPGSSHSSHHDRNEQGDSSARSTTDTHSGPPTDTSHGRAASKSRRRGTALFPMTAAQRPKQEFWDADDSDQEVAPDSSMIDSSTEPNFKDTPFQPDIDTETILCAISESRAGNFVGIATLNLTTGRAEVSHIINDDKFQYQRLIDVLSKREHLPHSFIIPERLAKPGETKSYLVRCLRKEFPSARIKPLQRSHWSETEGKRIVSESALDSEREAILAVLEKEFYVANAISAVFEYARRELGVAITPHSTCIEYAHPDDTLRLDRTAVSSLELIKPAKEARSKKASVLQMMDRTYTPAGRRLLRMSLLGPSTDRSEISHRQDAVQEFTNREEFLSDVCKGLKGLHRIDMERVITWIFRPEATPECPLAIGSVYSRNGVLLASHDDLKVAEQDLNQILMFKEYLEGVTALYKILAAERCSSTLGHWLEGQLAPEKLSEAQSVVRGGVNEDAGFSTKPIDARNNRIWAIRAPPGSGLEQSRASYRDATNSLAQHVDELNKVLGDFMGEEGKLHQDSDRRSVLSFPISAVVQKLPEYVKKAGIHDDFGFRLPEEWANQLPGTNEFTAIRKQSYYVVYSVELFEMSRRTQLYADMATEESDKYVVELKRRLRTTDRLPMFEMNDAVAILDMICSFAQLSASLNYVRPELSDKLVLQGARNPIVETRMQNYIPADVYLGDDSHRCLVLNGGNMSGKSTLVKTVGLIQIMAQMGCFVPANYAQLPICKQVFTRLSTEDKPENNLGTFGVETTDMNMILRHATKDSLVLIDEFGRGTSHSDGLALAKAMALDLIETNARLVFATHFTEIGPELREKKPTMVTCRHFMAQTESDPNTGACQITITHTLAPGPMQYRDYGIDLSRRFLPEQITDFAHQVSDFLRNKTNRLPDDDAAHPVTSAISMLSKLKLGVQDIVKRLAQTSDEVDTDALAIEMKKLQVTALKRKDGLSALTTTPLAAAHNAIAHLPKALTPPMPRMQRPRGGPTEEQLMRWREEERRVMYDNQCLSVQKKGAPEERNEAGVKVAEPPRRVYRGRVEAKMEAVAVAAVDPAAEVNTEGLEEEMELDDEAELSQILDEARGKVHGWLKEDGL